MVIFGASGDLTKRLLVPALYNLACDGLLSPTTSRVLGTALDALTDESFRATHERGHQEVPHAQGVRPEASGTSSSAASTTCRAASPTCEVFETLQERGRRSSTRSTRPAATSSSTSPRRRSSSGSSATTSHKAGFKDGPGLEAHHRREAVRHRSASRRSSSTRRSSRNWDENQIYRVDHYLGKETVQNLLAFRFSNGMFEPLWNKNYIDNIQFNVSEAVDVEGRGGYYDRSGVLRDMMQNHMFQMLAYLCMESPGSFEPDAIRNEKAKLLQSVRIYTPEEVAQLRRARPVRPVERRDGKVKPGYRAGEGRQPELEHRDLRRGASCTSTTGAGRACRSTCARARRSGSAAPRSSSSSRRRPRSIFRGTPVDDARRRTDSSSTSSRTRASRCSSRPRSPGRRCSSSR